MGDSYYHYTITGNNMEEIRNTQYVRWGSEVGECFTSLFYPVGKRIGVFPFYESNRFTFWGYRS
jgi:hypothetical protein